MAEDPKKQIDKLENSIDKLEEKFASKLADIKEEIQEVSSQTKERDFWLHNKEEAKISDVKSDVIDVKSDVKEVKTGVISDVQEVKSDVQEVKSDVQEIKSDLEKIERANKTLFKMFAGLHQKLMGRSGWYYRWHLRPYSNKIHWATFFTYLLAIIVLVLINIYYVPQPISHAGAGIAKMLNYQGKLTNTSNIPVADGSYNMKISLYDAEAGGSCLWTWKGACGAVTAVPVTVSNGLFNVLLGDTSYQATNALTLNFNTDTYYLGVTVGADAEMSLRKRIGAVGYAYNSDTIDGIHASATATASYLLPLDASVDFALPDDSKVVFRDAGIYIQSSADGKLLLSSDGAGGDAIILSALSGGIDIDTDSTMTISTTNDELQIATGSQDVVLAGSADGTDALTITAGDILVTNGDFDLSAGDFNITLDAGDNASFTSNAAATADVLTVTSNTATDNVDALYVDVNNTGASNANGINIDLDVVTSGLGNGERTIGAYIDVNGLAGDNGNSQVIALLLNSAGSSGGATKGIGYSGTWTYGMDMNSTTFGQAEIRLSHSEAIANTTDDQIKLIGNDGTNNAAIIFDLDGVSAAIPTITAGANDLIAINDNLSIGVDGITTETLSNTGFVLGGDDLFVAGMAGIEGSVYSDTGFVTGASTTYGNGSISQTSSETLTIGTTSANLTVQAATAGDVIISLAGGAGDDFTVDSTVLVVESDDNQVGIGTASPGQKLTVEGTLGILETGDTPTLHTIIQGGDQTGSDITYTLPIAAPGVNGYVLSATTAGVMSWVVQSGGTGDITDVGSMSTGAAFADATADDDWLGLGASDGRIEFDNQATDEVNILAANVGIGTQTPGQKLTIEGTLGILETGGSPSFHSIFQGGDQGGDITYTLPTAAPASNGYLLSGTTGGVLSWAAQVAASPGKGYIAGLSTNNYQTDSYTKLLLQFNGADTATTFYDSALGNKTITKNNDAQIDTAQSEFGGSSGLFDGNGDWLTLSDSDDWAFGTGDFTLDTWVRFNALPTSGNWEMVANSYTDASNQWYFGLYNSAGTYQWKFANTAGGSTTVDMTKNTTVLVNTWYHVALIRNGNNWMIFQGGVQVGTTDVDADSVGNYSNFVVGVYQGPTFGFNGWIDELRISKGIARWTADFSGSLPSAKYNSSGDEITVSASNIVVEDVGGSLVSLVNPALAMDIMTSGANGLDTGSEAASTWYYIWAIYNGSTTAGLLSTSSTSPTMPGGYTYKSLLGAVYNDSKGDFYRYYQIGNKVNYTYEIQILTNGNATSYTSFPAGSTIPPNAVDISIHFLADWNTVSAAGSVYLSADGVNWVTKGFVSQSGYLQEELDAVINLRVAQTLYYYTSDSRAQASVWVNSFTLPIGGSGGGGGSGININGSDVTLSNTANKFGVGTASPAAKLEVEVGSTEALTGILVDQKDLDQIAMQLASSASATATMLDLATNNISGNMINIDWDGATNQADTALSGINIDLTNLTPDNDKALYGISINDAASAGAGSLEYGVYIQGTNWDYGVYSEDNIYTGGSLSILESSGATYKTIIQGGDQTGSDITYTLPIAAPGVNGYVLSATTAGVMSWVVQSGGTGDITDVGSMSTGAAFADATADDDWLGLGASDGRIEFDNQATDEVNILAANVGIGTQTPGQKLTIEGTLGILETGGSPSFHSIFQGGDQGGDITYTLPTAAPASNGYLLSGTTGGVLSWTSQVAASPGKGYIAGLQTNNYQTDSYTKLLLQFNGADAATTFYDSALGNKAITVGGTAQIDTAQFKFGGSSALFDGDSDYLLAPDSNDWYFGTGDFTIDTWARFNALPTAGNVMTIVGSYGNASNYWTLYIANSGGTYYLCFGNIVVGSWTIDFERITTLSTNTWYHLAIIRNGNTWKMFKDGSQIGADYSDADEVTDFGNNLYIGSMINYFNGWLDELRISKGIARWTADFSGSLPSAKYNSSGDEITVSASNIVVEDVGGSLVSLVNPALAMDIMTSGANGLDTGSEAASTWYYIWAIYNGSTTAGLLSTSSTSPTMPGGYTYKSLLGAVYNDSKGDFLRYYQYNGNVRYVSQIQALNNGAQTSYYAVPLGDYGVPAIATEALINAKVEPQTSSGSYNYTYISADGIHNYTTLISYYYSVGGATSVDTQQFTIPLITSQTIYYYHSFATCYLNLYVDGYTLNIGGSGGGGGSGININGSDVTLSNTANKFGVGTASPAAKLEVEVGSTEALTGILVDQKDLDQIAMQLASSASATATLFDVAANNVSGDLMNLDWDGATAATGNIIGTDIDLTNLTPTNNGANYAYGVSIKAPAANNDSTAYGLYVQGTTWDYGIYNADDTYLVGNVGINTAPSSKLDILNNATGVTSDNYKVFNLATTSASFNTTGGVLTNYGAYFSNTSTHTGAPPLTNIGLYVTASGAETNYSLIAMGGNVGIGTALPSSLFSVGSMNQFQVNSTGNLIYVNNVNYSWPSSQGAANSVLKNNGSGTLSWSAVPGLGNFSNLKTKNYQTDSYTKLLLQFNGADAATTFYDSSLSNKAVNLAGNAQIDTAQSKFGGSSGLFDGTLDYLGMSDSSDWAFGTGDFTIDYWVRFNALPASQIFIAMQATDVNNYWALQLANSAGTYSWIFSVATGGVTIASFSRTTTVSTNTWYHVAVVRNGNTWRIYQGGTELEADYSNSGSVGDYSGPLYVATHSLSTGYELNGWLDEFRISKGVARWTADFSGSLPSAKYNSSGDEIVITADSLVVADTSNNITELLGVNISTIDIMASGANGLDTGSEAASTWYYIWVIYDGSNIRGLLSTSSSSPSMPGSYTYKRLLGAVYNDSKGDFLRYYQYNGNVRYVSQIQALNNGAQTSYYAVPLGDYGVPAIATEALLQADANYATSGGNIGPVYISMNGVDTYTQLESAYYTTGVFYKDTQQFTIPMPTSQTIYYYVSYSNMRLSIFTQGFTLNL